VSEHQEEPWHEVEPSLDHDPIRARLDKLEARIASIEARLDEGNRGDDISDDLRAGIESAAAASRRTRG
jgi:multidrug resistance efflux pump